MMMTARIVITALALASAGCSTLAHEGGTAPDNPVTPGMIAIPAGQFTPLFAGTQRASIDAFQLDRHAVTNADFLAFVQSHPRWQKGHVKALFAEREYLKHWLSAANPGSQVNAQAPVVDVSWFSANAYCEAQGKRLPTTLEWEYAAQLPLPEGSGDIKSAILRWYEKLSTEHLPPVGSALENAIGVQDLHGLIWEWTLDFNDTMISGESRGDSALDKGLFCGSGVVGAADPSDYAAFMRFGFRSALKADYTLGNLGFRCARSEEISR